MRYSVSQAICGQGRQQLAPACLRHGRHSAAAAAFVVGIPAAAAFDRTGRGVSGRGKRRHGKTNNRCSTAHSRRGGLNGCPSGGGASDAEFSASPRFHWLAVGRYLLDIDLALTGHPRKA